MKNSSKHIIVAATIITALIFLMSPNLQAQSVYKLTTGKDVNIKVLGSSNIHDWTMVATGIVSQGEFKVEGEQLLTLTAFNLAVDVKSLKSEHESMDTRTYKAINADKFPKILYKLNSATISTIQKGKYLIKATGELTISGVSQTVVLNVTATINGDNTISCTGSEKIKLTDYKIDPPSFMLGAMKVTNDLTIQFNLLYTNSTTKTI